MNDPGLDEEIHNASNQVKERIGAKQNHEGKGADPGVDPDMDEEEEEENTLMPARWWYASTAFPLMAGTFGPMANAFSICALVENWRVKIPPGGTEEHGIDIKDPRWLIAVNAVSLVAALTANASLLLNMARRLPFKIAQPITILGFWIASVLLIALIAVASSNFHAPGVQNQALTQAYYYAIFAAGLYQIISYLMCATVYGAYKGHYSKEFKLTMAQRTLMLQTISFLMYLLLGALVYSHIEGWKFLDAVYWADFTSLTIGIGGDYVPTTHLGRGLLFPFALGGIIILGLVVGSIRSLVLDRGKKKLSARVTEKTRRKLVKRVTKNFETDNPKSKPALGLNKATTKALGMQPGDNSIPEKQRRRYEFEAMRKVQARAAQERKYFSLCTSMFAFAFLWFMGAFVFYKAERNQQWSYFESLYFSYTTLLTIGYGDFQPISNSGKPFFVFWSLLAIPTLTILISDMGDTVVKGIKDLTIWLGEITVLPSDEGGTTERLKYGMYKATLGKIEPGGKPRDIEKAESDENDDDFEELHPGLAKDFKERGLKRLRKRKQATTDRIASDAEQNEELAESEAKDRGDKVSEDEHHFKRTLISEIRKVYSDSNSSTPKKYTYDEWAYYLKLLGEDEDDSTLHQRAPDRTRNKEHAGDGEGDAEQAASELAGEDGAHGPGKANGKKEAVKWSWIGNRSPLMDSLDESEFLLEKLFRKLEESLQEAVAAKDANRAEDEQRRAQAAGSGSDSSDATLQNPGDKREE